MSSRPSTFTSRMSYAPGVSHAGSGSTGARIAAKEAELEGLRALREQSARLAKDMERLGDGVDTLVEGGDGE